MSKPQGSGGAAGVDLRLLWGCSPCPRPPGFDAHPQEAILPQVTEARGGWLGLRRELHRAPKRGGPSLMTYVGRGVVLLLRLGFSGSAPRHRLRWP